MTQDLFLRDKGLATWWNSIVQDTRFEHVLTYARAAVAESAPERAELRGAELLIHALISLPVSEPTAFQFPGSGLIHDVDKGPPAPTEPPEKPKKRK